MNKDDRDWCYGETRKTVDIKEVETSDTIVILEGQCVHQRRQGLYIRQVRTESTECAGRAKEI